MRRRGFLTSVGAAIACSVMPARLRADRLESLGVQLFSVREELAKDPDAVLRQVAMIGFREVEVWLPRTSALIRPRCDDSLTTTGSKQLHGIGQAGISYPNDSMRCCGIPRFSAVAT